MARMTEQELAEIREAAGDKLGFFPSACNKLLAELAEVARERDEARLWKDVAEARQASLDASRQKIAELEAEFRNVDAALRAEAEQAEQRGFDRGVEAAALAAYEEEEACGEDHFIAERLTARRIVKAIRQLKPAECSTTDSGSLQPVEVKR